MKDGKRVTIRPIRPEDEPLHDQVPREAFGAQRLSALLPAVEADAAHGSRAADRAFASSTTTARWRWWRSVTDGQGKPEILAVGRLSKLHGRNEAELAAVAIDDAQHKGLGTELYRRLIQLAREEKLSKVVSNMLPENREMRAICVKLGFKMLSSLEDNMIRAELKL